MVNYLKGLLRLLSLPAFFKKMRITDAMRLPLTTRSAILKTLLSSG